MITGICLQLLCCVEPQERYLNDLVTKRSCKTVQACLTKEKTDMMIGGMPAHRGAGAFIRPIPDDGKIPDRFEKVECAPLQDFLGQRTHVDLFVHWMYKGLSCLC